MIPEWLEKWRPLMPELEMYSNEYKGREKSLALFREIIAHYFWLYENLDIDERHNAQMKVQFEWMRAQFDEGLAKFNAGAMRGRGAGEATKIIGDHQLMVEAVKHERQKDAVNYLYDKINEIDPAIRRAPDMDATKLRRICRDYYKSNRKKFTH